MSHGRSEEWLLLDDVARETRASIDSVRSWIKAGVLPSSRPGKRRIVRRRDLEVFLKRNQKGDVKTVEK